MMLILLLFAAGCAVAFLALYVFGQVINDDLINENKDLKRKLATESRTARDRLTSLDLERAANAELRREVIRARAGILTPRRDRRPIISGRVQS